MIAQAREVSRNDLEVVAEWAKAEGYIFPCTDLGETSWCSMNHHVAAAVAAINGWRFGYPSCCVEAYVTDIEAGRHPAIRRGWIPTETGTRYVPCEACCHAIGREHFPVEVDQWEV